MNRKHNPWVALVALLLLTALLLTIVGCTDNTDVEEPESPRFVVEDMDEIERYYDVCIITDTETGVQYLLVKYGQGVGLTMLEPATEKEAKG